MIVHNRPADDVTELTDSLQRAQNHLTEKQFSFVQVVRDHHCWMTESGCCLLVTHQEDEDGRPREHGASYEADEETESEHDGTVEIRPPSVASVKALTAPNKCSWNPDGEMSALAFFKL